MRSILAAVFFMFLFQSSLAQSSIEVGKKYPFSSEVFEEERPIWIGLPNDYDSTISYPVIYVMDAEWQFDITLATVKELAANDKIPSHIVVGIPHIDRERRFKDLTFSTTARGSDGEMDSTLLNFFGEEQTGGGIKFHDYLVQEVLPFVEAKHKTNGFDVYIGHSLSGYYGAYLVAMNTPFNAFQLYDASIWYNSAEAITFVKKNLPKDYQTNVFLSSASGGRDKQQYNVDTQAEFDRMLKGRGVNSEVVEYKKENHGSVRLPSLIDGLSGLYEGFSVGYIFPYDTITVESANAHYASFSEKVNYTFSCPPDVYRWVGLANYTQQNWEQAIKAYELSPESFYDDPFFQAEIAETYLELGDLKMSLEHYEKLLELDPENEPANRLIPELKERTRSK